MKRAGHDAILAKGWVAAHHWLLLRRISQLSLLLLFMVGPLGGPWLLDGNFASSVFADRIRLSEPFIVAQQFAAGHRLPATALYGALTLIVFYILFGGRVFCSWVCPINMLTDAAAWLRHRLGLPPGRVPPRATRYWLLFGVLAAAAATGSLVWEVVNPVTLLPRELLFGFSSGIAVVVAVFIYDFLVAPRGWCGHLCPMGAFYAILGRYSLIRVRARRRDACTDCADCFIVCPEPQVIKPALKGSGTPVILGSACTNCGRCIDVCAENVFDVTLRFDRRAGALPTKSA